MKKPKVVIPLILLIIVAALAGKQLIFKSKFLYAGTVEATKIDVAARVSSVIGSIAVREGDRVEQRQTLLEMTCEDYKLAAELALDNFSRGEKLFAAGSMPRADFDTLKNKKEDADLKVAWCTVSSPLAGRVLTKYHEPGEMVTPGTKLFTLANLKDVYVYIYVPQPEIAKLQLGEKLTGYLPELQMRPFNGTITWISDEAEFTPKNVQTRAERERLVYSVKIAFPNEEEILKPGMSVEVELPTK